MEVIVVQNEESKAFYTEALQLLNESGIPYLLGGAFAIFHHTGLCRDTKDLDIFVKSVDYPKILKFFEKKGFNIELHDVRWLAKIWRGNYFIDVIFNSVNNICTVDDSWFEHAAEGELFEQKVRFLSAEELVWCKSYIWNRERFDGADINHLMLLYGKRMDWKRLLSRLDAHWNLLLAHLIMFQFVYPSDFHEIIPRWLFDELMERAKEQFDLPPCQVRVCRGLVIDNTQYAIDVKQLDYRAATIITT
jgi:hypothetical protein